jgi:rare lipoprotein A
MGGDSRARILPVVVALGLFLAGCSSSGPVASSHKGHWRAGQPNYTVAPYQVNGVWYYPKVDYGYDESGTASWYGPGFDQKQTADGEVYDMNGLSAAHKTLPLPSVVAVTNLQNGRELRLRVNDRGPFVDGRLIDVSRRAAQLLGFETVGTAPVRVRIMKQESIQVAEAAMRGEIGAVALAQAPAPASPPPPTQLAMAAPPSLRAAETIGAPPPASVAPLEPPPYRPPVAEAPRRETPSLIARAHAEPLRSAAAPPPVPAPKPILASTHSARIFVQAGAFAVPENAQRVRARIAALGPAEIVPGGAGGLYRVRLGPLPSEAAAARLLSKVVDSGFPGARIVGE